MRAHPPISVMQQHCFHAPVSVETPRFDTHVQHGKLLALITFVRQNPQHTATIHAIITRASA